MAITWPAKNNYATGDVLTATNMNGIGDDLNALFDNSFYAGKNKIINGDFGIWQRGTSFTSAGYSADRWQCNSNATFTASRQTFTAGSAPVAGYEGTYFYRMAKSSGGTYASVYQYIEDVRTFAGQTITISFWAKADSAASITVYAAQQFGSGGSGNVNITTTAVSITTSWARYSVTASVPSISGKTIGTNSNVDIELQYLNSAAINLDIWGVQVEAGSTATPFQTATGTIQGELAACQRYYIQLVDGTNQMIANGSNYSATEMDAVIHLPVPMRTAPTVVQTSGTDYFGFVRNGATDLFNSLTIGNTASSVSNAIGVYNATEISGTAGQAGFVRSANASARFALSAEL